MELFEHVRDAWYIVLKNKARSLLTMFGIIIGVMSVIVIMSVGAGAQSLILGQVKSLGSNLVGVLPGKSESNGPPAAALGIVVTTLTDNDTKALTKAGLEHIVAAASYVRGTGTMTYGDATTDGNYVGTNASYIDVESVTLEKGRFFSEEEEHGDAKVVILGSEIAKDLFADEDPLGKTIKVKRVTLQVIGVMKERGTSGFENQDGQVFLPLPVAQKLLLGINYVNFIRVKIDTAEAVDPSMEAMKYILRDRHTIDDPENDDFNIRSTNQGLEALTQITNALKFFLAAIAAISLVVGGIGIMNIMLAAVEERTREIGLRKAVGATRGAIMLQFLIETITITFLGGLIGIVIGAGISYLVSIIAVSRGYDWEFVVSPGSIILGCSVSIIVGLIFGLNPARRASALDPIEALRYE